MKTWNTRRMAVLGAAAGVLMAAGAARAQCSSAKLTASDAASSDFFGGAISLSDAGTNAGIMIGVGSDSTAAGADAGSVYTYGKVGGVWGQLSHFYASDGQPGDFFGAAVGNAGTMAVVGATGVGDNGGVYMFDRVGSNWVQGQKFTGLQAGESCGRALAITAEYGGWALVASPLRDVDLNANNGFSDPDAGEVTLLKRVNGTWQGHAIWPARYAVNAGKAAGEQFGSSVAIRGTVAVCGAPYGENINWPDNHGYVRVYVYNGTTWEISDWLVSNNAQEDDHYGAAVATDGQQIAIGAPDDDATAAQAGSAKSNSGCVYVQRMVNGEWFIDGQVFASDASDNARFGSSVSIEEDLMVVGAAGAKKAYVFRRYGSFDWRQIAVYGDPDDAAAGLFGGKVAIRNGDIVVGDQWDDAGVLTSSGAAYVFTAPDAFAAGDLCEAPGKVFGHGNYTGCTTNATLSGSMPCGALGPNGYGPDVWYSWTPQCSGNVIIDTFGSDFDTILSVHSDCPDAGLQHAVVCNDDSGFQNLYSTVTFNYTRGQTYLIRIGGYNGAKGNFVLRVNEWYIPPNDSCASPESIGTGFRAFPTCRATTDNVGTPACSASPNVQNIHNDVWFRYTAACNGTTTIDLCGSNYDTAIQVFAGSGCPGLGSIMVACDDDGSTAACQTPLASRVTFPTLAGFQYTVRVGGLVHGAYGNTLMDVRCQASCPVDYNQDTQVNVPDIFAMLAGWFAHEPAADWNQSEGYEVQDIFEYLGDWFGGC